MSGLPGPPLQAARPALRRYHGRLQPVATTRRPRVGVVIGSYNYGRFLPDCVGSVLSQPGVDVRAIVMDDASTDDTPQVCAELAGDPRVSVVRQTRNVGHLANFNAGLAEALASDVEYVVKLDADDALPPGALHRAASLMESRPGVGFVYGRYRRFSGASPPRVGTRQTGWTVWPGREWLAERCRRVFNVISNPEVVMNADALREAGPRFKDLPATYDYELWLRLAAVADVGRVEGAVQGLYRIHPASFQRTIHASYVTDIRGRLDAFRSVFDDPVTAGLPDREDLRAEAMRRLAEEAVDRVCHVYDRRRVATAPVTELLAIADDAWPGWRDLPVGARLRRREALGPRWAGLSPLAARHVKRRLDADLVRWRRRRWGL